MTNKELVGHIGKLVVISGVWALYPEPHNPGQRVVFSTNRPHVAVLVSVDTECRHAYTRCIHLLHPDFGPVYFHDDIENNTITLADNA